MTSNLDPKPKLIFDSIHPTLTMSVPVTLLSDRDAICLFLTLAERLGAFRDLPEPTVTAIYSNVNLNW